MLSSAIEPNERLKRKVCILVSKGRKGIFGAKLYESQCISSGA